MKPWTTRAILLSVLTAWLLSGADAWSLLEDSEELGDDDYQASKRELDLSNTVEESEEQEGALENTRALVDSEVVLTQSMVVKKDALSKRYYRTHHYHYYSYYRHGYHCARREYALLFLYTLVVGYIRTI
ncbi:UNVERIFIED_CONTAM: hypothetical protein FKN15_048005 [Acipenser sinensis]